jgi:tetratricopeptide (TPR) repeat protein
LSAHAARVSRGERGTAAAALVRFAAQSWLSIVIAASLGAMSLGVFQGGIESLGIGGQGLTPNVTLQMALTLGSGLLIAAAALLAPRTDSSRAWGLAAAIGLFALAGYTAISMVWSVDPANSWLEASRTFAYAATFAGAVALVRLAPGRWRSVLAGVLLATVAICAYALAAKVLPESLDASDRYARLALPFGYWNAVGLTAALGIPPCLWLGSRREGHGVVNALAAPLLCGLLITLLLSVSRGALVAAVLGVGLWFTFVPLRLRALALLAIGGASAAAAIAYAYSKPALSSDNIGLGPREYAGHRLGLVIGVALLVAFVAALVLRFAAERRPLGARGRRRLGLAVLVALALVPVAGIAALAHSSRGLSGSVSHAWNDLTNPNAVQPSADPSRLTQAGNDHALYWSLATKVFDRSPAIGAGAGSYPVADQRFMTSQALAVNAHSYVFQTLADLGIVGMLISLGFAAAWGVAALRATGLRRPRAPGADGAERIGLVTMLAVVLVFVVHSAVDWTWFVPADAVLALLVAGWLAGRGPHAASPAPPPLRPSRLRPPRARLAAAGAVAAIAIAALAAWAQWQPLRSADASSASAIALVNAVVDTSTGQSARARSEYGAARAGALTAISRNPLDITALAQLALYYAAVGDDRAAKATFERELALQPSNATSWQDLAEYEANLNTRAARRAAYRAYSTALYLDPQDLFLQREFLSLSGGAR